VLDNASNPPTISRNALISDFGLGVAKSVLEKLDAQDFKVVPNYENLLVGDVILSSQPARGWEKYFSEDAPIQVHQRTIPRFGSSTAPKWSHAMLYVGRLHVVESQVHSKSKDGNFRSGLRVAPLTLPSPDTELVICRRKNWQSIESFDGYRRNAALYGVVDHVVAPRSYDYSRIATLALDGKAGIFSDLVRKFIKARFHQSVICSEFVLECLAIGGQMLTQDWFQVSRSKDSYFYPADFAVHPDMELHAMEYLHLEKH